MTSEIIFKRARNKETKEIRFQQIKDKASILFDSMPYHKISISKLGDELNFTRANLYKYITSIEDVFLYILLDEINETIDDLSNHLLGEGTLETKAFVYSWTEIIMRHPRFMKLLSMLYIVIEQNSDLEALVNFKNKLVPYSKTAVKIIRHNFTDFSNSDAIKVLDYAISLILSRYPICYPAKIQRLAVEKSNFPYVFPDFKESYTEGLIFIINGLKLTKF